MFFVFFRKPDGAVFHWTKDGAFMSTFCSFSLRKLRKKSFQMPCANTTNNAFFFLYVCLLIFLQICLWRILKAAWTTSTASTIISSRPWSLDKVLNSKSDLVWPHDEQTELFSESQRKLCCAAGSQRTQKQNFMFRPVNWTVVHQCWVHITCWLYKRFHYCR